MQHNFPCSLCLLSNMLPLASGCFSVSLLLFELPLDKLFNLDEPRFPHLSNVVYNVNGIFVQRNLVPGVYEQMLMLTLTLSAQTLRLGLFCFFCPRSSLARVLRLPTFFSLMHPPVQVQLRSHPPSIFPFPTSPISCFLSVLCTHISYCIDTHALLKK